VRQAGHPLSAFFSGILKTKKRFEDVRQNKFPSAVILTPEAGLASECQTALRSFGLKKFSIVKEFAELQKQIIEHSFDIILVDTDALIDNDKNAIVSRLRSPNNHSQGVFVALSRVNSREELLELKEQGFASVMIKPISIGMMEQALSEVIERQRNQPIDRDALLTVHRLFLHGQTFEAERTLSIWLEKESESLEGLTLLALHQLKKQEFYRANQTIQKVLNIKPDYIPALQVKTRIALRLGQLNEAFQTLTREEKAVALIEAKRAESLTHTLKRDELDELTFCKTFKTREGITALLINLGLQLSKIGKSEDSYKLYYRALGPLEDENARFIALFNRGRLYLNSRRAAQAHADLSSAREMAPEELIPKIDELLIMCRNTETIVAAEEKKKTNLQLDQLSVQDLLSMGNVAQKPITKYKPFNKDEVLELVFLGKMQEETVPPESVNDWLQMKKQLMHILFLDELPLTDARPNSEEPPAEQGTK